jgi:hypothetical protein
MDKTLHDPLDVLLHPLGRTSAIWRTPTGVLPTWRWHACQAALNISAFKARELSCEEPAVAMDVVAAGAQAGQILINHDRRLLTVVVRSFANLG